MSEYEIDLAKKLIEMGCLLGGSRRMAEKYPDKVKVTDETDWDFYIDDDSEHRTNLENLGFVLQECPNRDYWDMLLNDMYKHPLYDIQVLIRNDLALYTRAFESIDADTYVNELWKSSPVRDHRISKLQFAAKVCAYFNNLFIEKRAA